MSLSDPLDIDVMLLQNGASFADPAGNVERASPGEARIEHDDAHSQHRDNEGDRGVEQRQISGKQKAGVDKVAGHVEGGADDVNPIEPMLVGISPIQRTPRDHRTDPLGLVPPNDQAEMLTHLYGGQPAQMAQEEEVGGEDGQCVDEEIESLTHQILAGQQTDAEQDQDMSENVIGFEKEQDRRRPVDGGTIGGGAVVRGLFF